MNCYVKSDTQRKTKSDTQRRTKSDTQRRSGFVGRYISGGPVPIRYDIVVARLSPDLHIWTELYARVGRERGMWIGADMVAPPKGFEILAIVGVTRAAEPPA